MIHILKTLAATEMVKEHQMLISLSVPKEHQMLISISYPSRG